MKLLVIGDEHKNRRLLAFGLCDSNMEARTASTPADLSRLGELRDIQVALIDWDMKSYAAPEFIAALRRTATNVPVVATVPSTLEADVARRAGASECVLKPLDVDKLHHVLRGYDLVAPTPAAAPESTDSGKKKSAPASSETKALFVSHNPAMKRLLDTAWRVAPTPASVLLLGENGTGKTVLAEAIHQRSARTGGPFVTVNCPCLKRELLESELFGHVRGAFTGAINDTIGKVAAADGGTLFLDEVGELPLDVQPKLLRLLQDRVYERVGEHRPRQANVRVIAATNRNLAAEVKAGHFREDLYYRLNVIALEVPPLRDRREDIMEAAHHLLKTIGEDLKREFRGFTPLASEALQAYDWPGNLRELRNAVERAAILAYRDILDLGDFDIPNSPRATPPQVGAYVSLAKIEEEHIRQVIERTTTLEHAARILGIDKSTLYRKRKRQHLHITDFDYPAETAACAG